MPHLPLVVTSLLPLSQSHTIDQAQHLARHYAADLFLDSFIYGAHTTAADALSSGLPVLALQGLKRHTHRRFGWAVFPMHSSVTCQDPVLLFCWFQVGALRQGCLAAFLQPCPTLVLL